MREGEDVYSALGRSHGGRYLIVFFICKTDNRALVISAREITASEKNVMQNAKTSVSNADCYEAIGEFWDAHDLGEHWDATRPAEFEVITQEERNYFPVETNANAAIARGRTARRHFG